jgi:glycogen(starch) synthase
VTEIDSCPARSPRRVLYWTEAFFPYMGGTEVLGASLIAGLRQRGYDFAVVTSHAHLELPDQEEHDGVPVHRFPFRAAATGRDAGRFLEILHRVSALKRAFAPDLIHVNAAGPSLFFHLRSANAHPAPWLFTPSAPLTDQATGRDTILGEAFRSADWVACLSAAQMSTIRRLAPETVDRSSVIYCGLEAPPGFPAPLPLEEPRVLCLGRHVRDKGFDVALSAFAKLTDRFPRVRLILIGEGPARSDLEEQAAALGIANAVEFLGRVPEVSPFLNAATLVLMPSRWEETFGLVALEAALMARPVVATRVGALPEVVLHGRTGLVVEKEDHAALAEAMAFLLEHPETAQRMGQAARERALETFSLRRSVDAYEALYRELAGRASRSVGVGAPTRSVP